VHDFEIIELCEVSQLNDRERHWQDEFDVLKKGLNCKLTNTNDRVGKMSAETCKKKSVAMTGKKHTAEAIDKMVDNCHLSKKVWCMEEEMLFNSGKEAARHAGIKHGTLLSKLSGSRPNDTSYRFWRADGKYSDKQELKDIRVKVISTATGQIFNSIREAAEFINMKRVTLGAMLRGYCPNKTEFMYYTP
jgi:hypothetical protein